MDDHLLRAKYGPRGVRPQAATTPAGQLRFGAGVFTSCGNARSLPTGKRLSNPSEPTTAAMPSAEGSREAGHAQFPAHSEKSHVLAGPRCTETAVREREWTASGLPEGASQVT
jgi:hypothetical protein